MGIFLAEEEKEVKGLFFSSLLHDSDFSKGEGVAGTQ